MTEIAGGARRGRWPQGLARLRGSAAPGGLCAGVLLLSIACGGEPPPPGSPSAPSGPVALEAQEPVDPVEVVDSGRTLSGVYILERPSPPVDAATWVFTDGGEYSRTRTLDHGRGDRSDSGTYVVDAAGNLVLFVEKRGDTPLAWAQRETLALGGDPRSVVTVTSSEGRAETLARAGDPPPAR